MHPSPNSVSLGSAAVSRALSRSRIRVSGTTRGPRRSVKRCKLWERPSFVLTIYLPVALAIMFVIDVPLGMWMKHFPTELRSIARVITDLGKGQEVLVLSGLIFILGWLIPARLWPKKITVAASEVITGAAFVFLSVAGGGLVAALIKNVIGRARPGLFETYGYLYFRPFAFDSHFASFPSGHSA